VPRLCCRARHVTVGGRKLAEMRKRIVSSVVEELEKDVRSEGRHRGTERVEKHFRSGESRFMPQPQPRVENEVGFQKR
jgi:hypothetical protein